jgi:hypothetical protein
MCGKIKKTTFNFTILQGIKGSNNLGGFKIRIAAKVISVLKIQLFYDIIAGYLLAKWR